MYKLKDNEFYLVSKEQSHILTDSMNHIELVASKRFVKGDDFTRTSKFLWEIIGQHPTKSLILLVSHISSTIDYNQVHIRLTNKELGLSKRAYYIALNILIDNNILVKVKGHHNLYALNALHLYKGNAFFWAVTYNKAQEMHELGVKVDPLLWMSPNNIKSFGNYNKPTDSCKKMYSKYLKLRDKK